MMSALVMITTLNQLNYHGLPRYVYLTTPLLFCLLGMLLNKYIGADIESRSMQVTDTILRRVGNRAWFMVSIIWVCVIVYSVYIFPGCMDEEMSQIRLQRYSDISIEEAEERIIVRNETIDINSEAWGERVSEPNAAAQDDTWFTGKPDETMICFVKLDAPQMDESKAVTKVVCNLRYRDFNGVTLYWKTGDMADYSESRVYTMPTLPYKSQYTFYIDGCVNELMIVPSRFREGTVSIDGFLVKWIDIASREGENGE